MNLKLSQKAALLIVIPFAFEILFVAILVAIQKQLETQYMLEAKSKDELSAANSELRLMLQAGSNIGMYHGTHDKRFLERFREARAELSREQANIIKAFADDQAIDLSELTKEIAAVSEKFDSIEHYIGTGDQIDLMRSALSANRLGKKISDLATTLMARANVVDKAQREKQMRLRIIEDAVVIAGVLLSAAIAVALAFYFHKGTTSRLQRLERNSHNLSQNKELEEQLDGFDEIANIDKSFHQMAELLLQARRREMALTENALDVICSFDSNGIIKRVNAAAESLWGFPPNELLESSILRLVPEKDKSSALQNIKATLAIRNPTPFEVPMAHKSGEERVTQWSLQWSDSEQAFFAVLHDISERKRIERLKQEVLAMVSHDMRSPLTSLDLHLSLLQTGTLGQLNEKGTTRVEQSRNVLRRLISMINHLLDMEKLDSGAIELKTALFHSQDLVNRAHESVIGVAESKNITFSFDVQPAEILCDGEQLISVLVNLLDNAIKFSPPAGLIKVVALQMADKIEFQVIDRGRGVPAAKSKLIFERFKQSQSSDQYELKGSGLGLAICKSIVEAHKGIIGCKLNSDVGTTFWFRIPLIFD